MPKTVCKKCGGAGKVDRYNLCPVCRGTGTVNGPKPD